MNRSETPRFDLWGQEMSGARPRTRRPARRRVRISGLRLAAFGLIVAACAAVLVHLIDGTASADPRLTSPQAIAGAIDLRLADLPGFRTQHDANSSVGDQLGQSLGDCVGASGPTLSAALGGQASATFSGGSGLNATGIASFVSVGSSAQVSRDSSVMHGRRFTACFADTLAKAITADNSSLSASSPQVMALPAPVDIDGGARTQLAMRASITVSEGGLSFTAWVDFYFLTVGRDEIGLMAFTLEQPYALGSEQRLAALMVSRARALPH
jgi:hypothetical protein